MNIYKINRKIGHRKPGEHYFLHSLIRENDTFIHNELCVRYFITIGAITEIAPVHTTSGPIQHNQATLLAIITEQEKILRRVISAEKSILEVVLGTSDALRHIK